MSQQAARTTKVAELLAAQKVAADAAHTNAQGETEAFKTAAAQQAALLLAQQQQEAARIADMTDHTAAMAAIATALTNIQAQQLARLQNIHEILAANQNQERGAEGLPAPKDLLRKDGPQLSFPYFDGDFLNLDHFLEDYLAVCKYYQMSDSQMLSLIGGQINNKTARATHERLYLDLPKEERVKTFAEYMTIIREGLSPEVCRIQYLLEFRSREQKKGETIEKFVSESKKLLLRAQPLLAKAENVTIRDDILLLKLVESIQPESAKQVWLAQPKNLTDAITAATLASAASKQFPEAGKETAGVNEVSTPMGGKVYPTRSFERRPMKQENKCDYCRFKGHNSADCRRRKADECYQETQQMGQPQYTQQYMEQKPTYQQYGGQNQGQQYTQIQPQQGMTQQTRLPNQMDTPQQFVPQDQSYSQNGGQSRFMRPNQGNGQQGNYQGGTFYNSNRYNGPKNSFRGRSFRGRSMAPRPFR